MRNDLIVFNWAVYHIKDITFRGQHFTLKMEICHV